MDLESIRALQRRITTFECRVSQDAEGSITSPARMVGDDVEQLIGEMSEIIDENN